MQMCHNTTYFYTFSQWRMTFKMCVITCELEKKFCFSFWHLFSSARAAITSHNAKVGYSLLWCHHWQHCYFDTCFLFSVCPMCWSQDTAGELQDWVIEPIPWWHWVNVFIILWRWRTRNKTEEEETEKRHKWSQWYGRCIKTRTLPFIFIYCCLLGIFNFSILDWWNMKM